MRCLCVVCALSVRCLCAVCALSAPSRHDAPRMYELGVPVLLGEKPTARRQNLSRSPMTLPNFQPRHPVGNARVHVFWARARLADLGFALHVFSLLRTVMTPPACTLARAWCGGVTPDMGSRAASPTHERTSLWKNVNRTFLHRIFGIYKFYPSVFCNDVRD